MRIKMIRPALEDEKSAYWRSLKYSLFPPMGLAAVAALCQPDDEVTITDEHVEKLDTEDDPELVVLQAFITNAYRTYAIADYYRARGSYVAIGGLHATTLPYEVKEHADTVISGLAEGAFPQFLDDLKRNCARPFYNCVDVDFDTVPLPRRDLYKKENYLVPNSMAFSRGCPHRCKFCYVTSIYPEGKSYYACKIDRILKEIGTLPGRQLYFLDDNLFADKRLARELFREMRGMGRVFQGAVTVKDVLADDLIEQACEAGLRSAFIGFESIRAEGLRQVNKQSNIGQDYKSAINKMDNLGIMINGSFIFGMEGDTAQTFADTADWAVQSGIATATFHILTPYPGTGLYADMKRQGKMVSDNWNDYDTRHLVFRHGTLSKEEMEEGYAAAYKTFYKWRNIFGAARAHEKTNMKIKHVLYAGAWKKLEPVWNFIVKQKLFPPARRALERVLQ